MIAAQPVLGVGPGNWPVRYPSYALEADPSYRPESLFPTSRLPHGDWMGLAAERGVAAPALLLMIAGFLWASAWRRLAAQHDGQRSVALALLASISCVATIGASDPFLLTPTGAFMSAVVLGVLTPRCSTVHSLHLTKSTRVGIVTVLAVACGASVLYSTNQLRAALQYANGYSTESLTEAVRLNPGDYHAQVLLVQRWIRLGHCERALAHVHSASNLLPFSGVPRYYQTRCAIPPFLEASTHQAPQSVH
jgi:hypothetical protein